MTMGSSQKANVFFYCQIQKANVNNVFDQKNDVNNVPVPMG